MKNEERVTLEMSMEDYGYVVNTLKSMQINLAGTDIATTRMSIGIAGSLNILERSQVVLDIWGNINRAMVKGYVNTLNEAANDIARGKATQQTVMDIKDVASSLSNHMPKEACGLKELEQCSTDDNYDEVLDDHEDRISELYEEVSNIKDQFKSCDNADRALHRRLQFVEDRLKNVNITALDLKFDNNIDRLEEVVNNTMKTVDILKNRIYNIENNVNDLYRDKRELWDIVTGCDDSIDERLEGVSHHLECLIERDDDFFNKVKELKNEYSRLDERVTALENKAKPHISCVDEIIDAVNKFEITPASFSMYFENNKKKEDNDE